MFSLNMKSLHRNGAPVFPARSRSMYSNKKWCINEITTDLADFIVQFGVNFVLI